MTALEENLMQATSQQRGELDEQVSTRALCDVYSSA